MPNTGSDKYLTPHAPTSTLTTGWREGTQTDQRMEGSMQVPDRGSSMQTSGLKNPAHRGTFPRVRPKGR